MLLSVLGNAISKTAQNKKIVFEKVNVKGCGAQTLCLLSDCKYTKHNISYKFECPGSTPESSWC